MLRKTISICILLALISTIFSRYWVYLGFEINEKYITENLCENRARPQMHCKGKCFLMKKLKQAEENEKKHDKENLLKNLELTFILESTKLLCFNSLKYNIVSLVLLEYCPFYSNEYVRGIFHPPKTTLPIVA